MAAGIPDSDLELLLRALRQAIADAGPSLEGESTDLARRLGKAIIDAYVRGERDPEKLKQAALKSI